MVLVAIETLGGLCNLLELHLGAGRLGSAPDIQTHGRDIFGENFVDPGAGVVRHCDLIEEVSMVEKSVKLIAMCKMRC